MTVTQNAVKREGPQHRLVVLSCWFVSQQRSVGSLRLKVVSHCGETRALWQATPTQHAELQKWHVRETFWICNEVPALTTAFNNIKKKKKKLKTLLSLLAVKFVVNNILVYKKRDMRRTGRQWVIQHKRHECCVPVLSRPNCPMSNEPTWEGGHERHNKEKKERCDPVCMCIPITVAFKPSDGYFIKGNIASHIWFLFEQKAEKILGMDGAHLL